MGNSTIYDVVARMSMKDAGASAGFHSVRRAADDAARSTSKLGTSLASAGAAVGTYFTLRSAYSGLITYNKGLEDTKNSLATIINLNQKGTWESSVGKGARLMEQFKEDAKTSAGTMREMADFASAIINPVLAAGGTLEDLRLFTKQSVVAAASFGASNEVAAMDMIQALRGTASAKDKVTSGLLGSIGMDNEQFNAKSAKERFELLRTLLSSDSLKKSAVAQGQSMTGLMSTTMDNLEQTVGTVGKGLFDSLKGTFQELNNWIEKNQSSIKSFATELGAAFKTAFSIAKEAFGFLLEHKELLLNLAKAWLVGKAARGIGTTMMVEGIGGIAKLGEWQEAIKAGGGLGSTAAGFAKTASGVLMLGQAAYFAASQIASWVDEHQDSTLDDDARKAGFKNQLEMASKFGGGAAAVFYKDALANGQLDRNGQMKYESLRDSGIGYEQWGAIQKALDAGAAVVGKRQLGFLETNLKGIGSILAAEMVKAKGARDVDEARFGLDMRMGGIFGPIGTAMGRTFGDEAVAKLRAYDAEWALARSSNSGFLGLGQFFGRMKPQINVNKLVIDVKSDDPDRLVMGIEGYLTDYLHNGTPPTSLRSR